MNTLISRALITLSLAIRNGFRNPRRTWLTLIAVVVGISSTVALAALARGIASQMVSDSIYNLTGHLQLQAPQFIDDPAVEHFFQISSEELEQIRSLKGVRAVLPRIVVPAVFRSEREGLPVTLVGIYPSREQGLSLAGQSVAAGASLSGPSDTGIIVGQKLLEDLRTKLNRRVVGMTQGIGNEIVDRGFRAEGSFHASIQMVETQFVFAGINTAREMLQLPKGAYHQISIVLDEGASPEEIQILLKELFPTISVLTWKELQPLVVSMAKIQNGFLIIWFVIVIVSAGFGLVNSLLMSIFERVRELAVMHALGMTRTWIVLETVTQSFFLLLVGGMVGSLLGGVCVWMLSDGIDISQFARGLSIAGIGEVVIPRLFLSDVILIFSLLVGIGTLGSLYPAWHAARVDPSHSLQRI